MTRGGARGLANGSSGWPRALGAVALVWLAILFLYRETAWSMVEIWARSDTFMHAFLVPPIALWLIWRIRDRVMLLVPSPNPWVFLLLVVSGFFWFLGQLATVGVLSQFALIAMLVLSIPALLGWSVARSIVFPLMFLFFCVPFGEFAMPQLMEWTANVTVVGLRLTGVPVYREGLRFVIPSGSWSVVEACSGVRYLIASITVGALFAYLTYRSFWRRLAFIGLSLIVPIVANWMRAYLIVMLGHLSGNKLAAGVDHLIYGWLFFGLVIMGMFWVGARWTEDDQVTIEKTEGVIRELGSPGRQVAFGVLAMACVSLWPFAQWRIEHRALSPVVAIQPLASISGWDPDQEAFSDWLPHFENPSASLHAFLRDRDGKRAAVFVAYYRDQGPNRKMVSSANVLARSDDPVWAKVGEKAQPVVLNGQPVVVSSTELKSSITADQLLVWRWYWVNGRLTNSDAVAKALTAWSQLLGQGDDSALIAVYAPMKQEGGEEALSRFATSITTELMTSLKRTRDLK